MSGDRGATVSSPGDLDAFAAEVGPAGPVACVGGRTAWEVGGPLATGATEVRAPVGIVEHEPAEMTVRVRAGTTVDELQRHLAGSNQRVMLPSPGVGATVGGVLAVGRSDVRRLAYGPVRDVVLEARYVSADGRIVKAGGPTVKNVSGFDLCRLLVGSLGTVGLLGEVVLRTRPMPEACRWFDSSGSDRRRQAVDPFALVHELHRPAAVLWDGTVVSVLLEGREVDVDAQAEVLARHGLSAATSGPDLPARVTSHRPAALASIPSMTAGRFVAEIGVGTVHSEEPLRVPEPPPSIVEQNRRVTRELDPTGRLNPGRDPLHRDDAVGPAAGRSRARPA